MTKKELIKEYLELIVDETALVRERAILSFLRLLDFFDHGISALVYLLSFRSDLHYLTPKDLKQNYAIPSFRKYCEDKADTLPLAVKEFGRFIWLVKGIVL
jgi:hypothetical protein